MVPKRIWGSTLCVNFFRIVDEATYYEQYKTCQLIDSKSLDQSRLPFSIIECFAFSTLLPLFTFKFTYNFELVYVFFSNLIMTTDHSSMKSDIHYREVFLTLEDF